MKYLIILGLVFIAACTTNISSFQECKDAGYDVQESFPRQCTANGETFTEEISAQEICIESGGNFLAEYNECEFIDKTTCDNLNGEYHECASACRHTDADICTKQCVPVCKI